MSHCVDRLQCYFARLPRCLRCACPSWWMVCPTRSLQPSAANGAGCSRNVLGRQLEIRFGHTGKSAGRRSIIDEIEVDEGVVRKKFENGKSVVWHEYVGMVRRGDPSSLVLVQRPELIATSRRAIETRGHAVLPPMRCAPRSCALTPLCTRTVLLHIEATHSLRAARGVRRIQDYLRTT